VTQSRDLIGLVLNETYRIERLIGEGGMGAVYEASHLRGHRRVAVKLLAPRWGALSDEEAVARFRREAEVTRQLGHPHIVEVTDADQTDDGLLYFVMELLEGEDLGELLRRRGRLPAPLTAAILEQTASALEAAHLRSVVHRDLKPSNIFLCGREGEAPHVKVMDFSLSKVLGAAAGPTDESIVLGTPWYMAPEQAQGRSAEVTPQTDVYAAGAILYRMVTGEPPFNTPVLDDLLEAIAAAEPRPPRELAPELSAEIEAVILRALSKRPGDRYPSMLRLAESFTAAVDDPFAHEPTDRWEAQKPPAGETVVRPLTEDDLKLNTPPPLLDVTPPVERIDDLKTPPLERVAAGEVEQAEGLELREEPLPSVMAPEVEDAPTIPAVDPVVRLALPSMRPDAARNGKLPEIHTGKTDPDPTDSALATPTDPDGEPTEPTGTPPAGRPERDVPTVIVEPAATTPPPAADYRRRGGRHLLAAAGVLTVAAIGIALWLYRSPSPTATEGSRVDAGAPDSPGERQWREVWLDSDPTAASTYLDGTLLGKTPLRGARVPTRRVELLLARRGFEDRRVLLEPGLGVARLGVVALEPRPTERAVTRGEAGTLVITTRHADRPAWADVFLDGTRIGRSPVVRRVRPGLHRIEARRAGFRVAVVRLRVQAGVKQRVVLALRR
jgi:serine/threonine-protein kinase